MPGQDAKAIEAAERVVAGMTEQLAKRPQAMRSRAMAWLIRALVRATLVSLRRAPH